MYKMALVSFTNAPRLEERMVLEAAKRGWHVLLLTNTPVAALVCEALDIPYTLYGDDPLLCLRHKVRKLDSGLTTREFKAEIELSRKADRTVIIGKSKEAKRLERTLRKFGRIVKRIG